MTKMKEADDMERKATASQVAKAEETFKEETRKIRVGKATLPNHQN